MPPTITRNSIITQNFTDGSPSNPSTLTVVRRVVTNTAADVTSAVDNAVILGAVGKPLSSLRGTPVKTERLGMMRLRQVNAVPVAGSESKVFDVTARYDQLYTWAEHKDLTGQLVLPVEVELDATPRSAIMYRSPSWTTNPTADLNTTTDIGGTKVDYASRPVQTLVRQMTARVSFICDVADRTDGITLVGWYDKIDGISGKWNSAAFLHWSTASQVYCESASISPVRDEYYRVTFNFRWDAWKGCEQVPKTDVWGKAAIDANGQAQTVTWKSQVRSTANFSTIFAPFYTTALTEYIAKHGQFLSYPTV